MTTTVAAIITNDSAIAHENQTIKKTHPPVCPHEKAKQETASLKSLVVHWDTDTPTAQKIKKAWMDTYPDEPVFDKIIVVGGRKKHYDIILQWISSNYDIIKMKQGEVKFKQKNIKIDPSKNPWSYCVQYLNGHGSDFTIGHRYADSFYTELDKLITEYNITAPKPTLEEWKKDAFGGKKPTTPFVSELREKGYKSTFLSKLRTDFNKRFVDTITEEDLKTVEREVYEKTNEVFNEKDYWLQIHGNLDDPDHFNVRWSNKVMMNKIIKTEQVITKSNYDVNFKFTCDDGKEYAAKLRWGYGQCITNIRLDLK
jgi:hypothetical protein